ncbi:acyl-CoA N-acyltransferase [Westerdykella ornata]|uniref:Histone acetyltransferase type B catalytic subunit n=1 Tax=Westerdykella ornata TaxID=318751 RepID=A0A6A6JNB1_WESOR|nr:acyl-CoA N-acyltransferase [Westerdykella ornata]KAF2277734.1 acyl-CoA N-acyltransferase [Westerdykella ornata]
MDVDIEDWVHDAKECIEINFFRPSTNAERVNKEPLHPEFAYSLFGEEESIVGYRDPKITLNYRANDLQVTLDIKSKGKVDLATLLPNAEVKQVDINKVFEEHISTGKIESTTNRDPDALSNTWKPPGERLRSFELNGRQYEIWSTSLADLVALQLWKRIQILVLFYVDGASPLELDEDWTYERWTLHLLYEVTPLKDASTSPYTLAGFSTSHRYWILPTLEVMRATQHLPSPPPSSNGDASEQFPPRIELAQQDEPRIFKEQVNVLELPSRERISQFLILPHFQGLGLGTRLYQTLFSHYVEAKNIYEIPVEDPNEDFDRMRDYCDILYLRKIPEFNNLTLASSLPPEKLHKKAPIPRDEILGNGTDLTALRHKAKIVPRQFDRMLELHLLSTIPPAHRSRARITRKEKASNENDRRYYFWRLALKARIYRQNADVLDQLKDEPEERVSKLEDAVDSQQAEYEERLEALEKRQRAASRGTVRSEGDNSVPKGTKRSRVVVEDEDEDSEGVGSVSSKKARA